VTNAFPPPYVKLVVSILFILFSITLSLGVQNENRKSFQFNKSFSFS
jgi:hypothetical protein